MDRNTGGWKIQECGARALREGGGGFPRKQNPFGANVPKQQTGQVTQKAQSVLVAPLGGPATG